MPTGALSSRTAVLKIGDGATPENFTTIAEVKDIKGPGLKLNTEDVTSHDSTDGWEEKIATTLAAGNVTFDINLAPASATHGLTTGLLYDMVNRMRRNFQLVFPNVGATTWTIPAFVAEFSPSNPVKGALTSSITLEIAGKPTLA